MCWNILLKTKNQLILLQFKAYVQRKGQKRSTSLENITSFGNPNIPFCKDEKRLN